MPRLVQAGVCKQISAVNRVPELCVSLLRRWKQALSETHGAVVCYKPYPHNDVGALYSLQSRPLAKISVYEGHSLLLFQ